MNSRSFRKDLPILALAATGALSALPAAAQDEGLYPEPSAPDASFLRVYAPGGDRVTIAGGSHVPGKSGLTSYVEIAPGEVPVEVGGTETVIEAGPNLHYSLLAPEEGTPETDAVTGSPAQGDLVFYNLTELEGVDLYVPSAEATAVGGVGPMSGAGVALNAPLTLTFEVRHEGETLAVVEGVEMRRGGGTTVLFAGGSGNRTATAEANTYE
ncbi:hypothetical protein [Histidinibacterium lentulum]|uniref:Alginate biosynthesis protein AlgF n=1 Tax=Histidinibacterium lentulum TaxID=2480588 RepID=A0A3N2R858_9RHOB|nr:hypothetical protein [Histidinibacterium lentulum]ROU03625.1 hypothetical protein EAT49_04835 [Histidinibacterium lentulum]